MFDSGVYGKDPIDFIDFRTTDAFSLVADQPNYYPDVAGYTNYSAYITPITGPITTVTASQTIALVNQILLSTTTGLHINDTITFGGTVFGGIISGQIYYITNIQDSKITISTVRNGATLQLASASGTMTTNIVKYSTIIRVLTTDVFGLFSINQYIADSTDILPNNSYISNITSDTTYTYYTVSWYEPIASISATSIASLVTADTTVSNYAVFDGSRIVFAADTNDAVRNKIYVVRFSTVITGGTPVITLTEASDGLVLPDEQTAVYRGYNYKGKDFYFNGTSWIEGQQKLTVNQPPKFDVFDENYISFGNTEVYVGTSFTGSTLFRYGVGTGTNDPVLGFPIRYSGVDNVGDISFDVTLNSETFSYVFGQNPIVQNVNTGYVYNYSDRTNFVRELGWQTAVSPSVQYQIFEFPWNILTPQTTFTCDIAPMTSAETNWPVVKVYVNNVLQDNTAYTYTTTSNSTTITLSVTGTVDTVIQVLILSNQVSTTGYYEVPINLNNNPFNDDITSVNIGEIRGQYQSIFYNNPNTTGVLFGANNYRDLGNLVPWGNAIIQNSASMVLPGTFLRKQDCNLFDSLMFNSRQYVNFKTLLVGTVDASDYTVYMSPAQMLDDALSQITSSYVDTQSFFWSDMVPSKAPYITNSYSFANSLDVSIYPLSKVYNFASATYDGVLVYLTRNSKVTQLIYGVNYTISTTAPSLTIITDLLPNDIITINEYNQTYGSYVPNTPTKLGLYPASIPEVILDAAYSQPTYFILGHDGSYNKLYGDYDPITGVLIDFRDQVLLEYEKRVYNNLKLSNTIPVQEYEVLPGFFRQTDYTYNETLEIYSQSFLDWVGQNRIDYKTQFYSKINEYSFNYRNSQTKINPQPIEQGYWRGVYQYFYDTSTPNTSPWQMIGYRNMPSWWTARYGSAPYTSDNLVLWDDLAQGIDWNNGNPIVLKQYIRTGLQDVLPVDSDGNLISPLYAVVGNYNNNIFQRDWKVGDVGPTELSYRRSSSYPFDLMRIFALTKPAEFYNLAVDVDNYKYNVEFNQYLVNNRSHLKISDIQVYGSGTPSTSYINWIIDYQKQVGIDATTNVNNILNQLDVRLVYRLAGFSDKSMLSFYVEKSSANSNNSSLLIPDESYSVLLYDNQPFNKIVYSGIVIQIASNGYYVYGNSQTNAYFQTVVPKATQNKETIAVENLSVTVVNEYYQDKVALVPYNTLFYTPQEVSQFLVSYGKYLESQGMQFDQVENGIPIIWNQMVAEFLYWAQMGWEVGTIVTLNPAATFLSINKDSNIVQPLTIQNQNFVLNSNLYPIKINELAINRDGTLFTVQPLNQGDAISYGQFNVSNIEHGIVFNNVTVFNDIIYNLPTGLRQNRVYVRGTKTAEWNGTLDAYGFIYNQDNVIEWDKNIKYTKSSIVKYKNKYWTALKIVQPSLVFDEQQWKETAYNEIQKGLLPNPSTRAYESTLYYDVNKANLENDADLLSFSLIGFRPRDYLAVADLTDITQVNVYQNMIKKKGTLDAASAFKGATLPQGGINYDIYENWEILSGEFGGVLNNNFVEFKLSESELTGNPSTVGLTNGVWIDGVQQQVPLYSLYNYNKPIVDPNVLTTIPATSPSSLFPNAGYVNFNDVKMSSYFYSGLGIARDQANTIIPIDQFYVRDYAWIANYLEKWRVFSPSSIGTIVGAKNNLNNTVTIQFDKPHNLSKYELLGIVNFNTQVNGYYLVATVVDPYRVIINLALAPSTTSIVSLGVGFRLQDNRVATAPEIGTLPLLDNEFNKSKVWVDENNDGSWAVYRKSLNYQYDNEVLNNTSGTFGSAVAYDSTLGYLIGDATTGVVYRYTYGDNNTLSTTQSLTGNSSFGSTISYANNFFVISEPTSVSPVVNIYYHEKTTLVDTLTLYQSISAPSGVTNWGSATAISGDSNWIYISDTGHNLVYVYRKSQTTPYQYKQVGTISTGSSSAGDAFGSSISTDYYGDTVVIGAPYQDYSSISNYGYAYVFSRTVQNFEVMSAGYPYIPQTFPLSWTPPNVVATANATTTGTNVISLVSAAGITVGDPVILSGTILSPGALAADTVYYVVNVNTGANTIQLSTTKGGSVIPLVTTTGTMTIIVQTSPIYVHLNGTLLDKTSYAVIGSTFYLLNGSPALTIAGDIINVSGSNFVLEQTLSNGMTPSIGVEFGTSTDTNMYANEILIGSPFELDANNHEGAVHRFTNGGERYGMVVGTSACNITTPRVILINGFAVTLPIGNASATAAVINIAKITNVTASSIDGYLAIALIDASLANPNNKLSITVVNSATPAELGFNIYTETQIIHTPHIQGSTQFGTVVKFNESGSFVASAPTGTRYTATTFDFTDDGLDNDTIFDNATTTFNDSFVNAGAVYMFDYISAYNENLSNPGLFIYAQSVNAQDISYGSQPMFGQALDFTNDTVAIGTPLYKPGVNNGQFISYTNAVGEQDWAVYRSSSPVVNIDRIENTQIFSASTNDTLINLDYFDPLQGKLLGAVRENIDVISNIDPASYNSPNATQSGLIWGADKVGSIWFDTTNIRFVNYHQNDVIYDSKYWGAIFPGSDVAVYSWVASNVTPLQYTGPGTPYGFNDYTTQGVINAEGTISATYYFWVRNTNVIFEKTGKTLADSVIQSYIAQPVQSGISYMSPVLPSVFALYNCSGYINANDSVFHLGYSTGITNDPSHTVHNLIRANYADDFLPGLPKTINDAPKSLYARYLDSLSGTNIEGAVVPDPFLPLSVQSGVLVRPRQSFFYNRLAALRNLITFVNSILIQYPFIEISDSVFLYKVGPINPSTGFPFYSVADYVDNVNWWATGYSDNTKASMQVQIYADLLTLSVPTGTIVTVLTNGNGVQETYILEATGTWARIGLQYGTIQISSVLYDYANNNIGFGNNFFDTTPYDEYPSEETRDIVRALNEELPQNLLITRNQALILLFEYIQAETVENQNFLPWLNKTSLIDVSHTIRELKPIEVFQSDNQLFLQGYLNEVKPYHVVIKDFLFKYTGTDVYEGDITDFDLPAQFNTSLQKFISPELVYSNPNNDSEYLPSDVIWTNSAYTQWFNNYGLSLTGQTGYLISVLKSYVSLNSGSMYVDTISGFPVTGSVTIGTEQIGYSSIDYLNNQLLGLSRGLNNTTIQQHIPGENIYIDLPAVVILNGGRNYSEPPKITAYIDTTIYPAPKVPAQLQPIMGLGTVIGVEVLSSGEGYAVLPKIIIDPAFSVTFNSLNVDPVNSTIELSIPLLSTGDLIVYRPVDGSISIGGLEYGQKYFVGVLETSPTALIAVYNTYIDAAEDRNRIPFYGIGSGDQIFEVGAIASTITSASPVRETNITLRYDRTSYTPQVIDWIPGNFYGSFYAGSIDARSRVSSSSFKLAQVLPSIYNVESSAVSAAVGDITFEILKAENEQILVWSSRTRNTIRTYGSADIVYPNVIQIAPSAGGSPSAGFLGSTIGFYVGMPIKFEGSATGGILNDVTYYVKSLVNIVGEPLGLTISETVDANGNPGAVKSLTSAIVPSEGLLLYPGEVTNTALLTINYPGIRNLSATTSGKNTLTVDLIETGLGGTNGFYTGLPLFFVGNVFGGIIENEIYYVTSILDLQTFTMSTNPSPMTMNISATTSLTKGITCTTTLSLSLNQPIVFSGTLIGGLQSNVIYYINQILSTTSFTVSTSINGTPVSLTDDTVPSGETLIFVSQSECVNLTTDTGSLTLNVSLPVSPGQINGQPFTVYGTGEPYKDVSGVVSNLITDSITATLTTVNRICLTRFSQNNSLLYSNFQFQIASAIGGLSTATTYTVTGTGITTVTVTNTTSTGNYLTCSSSDIKNLYVNMYIQFTGESLGGVLLNTPYYVNSIDAPGHKFTITRTLGGGSDYPLTFQNGTMTGTGDPYITISNSLTTEVAIPEVVLTQVVGTTSKFDISYIMGGYTYQVTTAGTRYAVNNLITIPGSSLGGVDTINDCILEVTSINGTGGVVTAIASGTPSGNEHSYYFKVIDETQVAVFSDPILTVPVSGQNFPFVGVTSTTATVATASNDRFTVTSSIDFNVNDPVVFTGTVFGGIILGQTYYVLTKPSITTVTISTSIGGTVFDISANATGSMTMAKMGDYAVLNTPFFFNTSLVKYNKNVYQCIVSNNDADFIFGKWQLLQSGDRNLNELDRIVGYYQPTINMPGLDISQLVSGTTFPGSTYRGNKFAPNEEFIIDTILTDQPFYPSGIMIQSVIFNGSSYKAVSNTENYSAINTSPDSISWSVQKVTNNPIDVTDILYASGYYLTTANNDSLPLLRSSDGITWSNISAPSTGLRSITYNDGVYVAVGNNIIASFDTLTWIEAFNFTTGLTNQLTGVSYINTIGFTGFMAVGLGINNLTQVGAIIKKSIDGIIWQDVIFTDTLSSFNALTYNTYNVVIVGDNGTIYTGFNTLDWYPQSSGVIYNLNSVTWADNLFVAVGDNGTIITALSDAITWTVRSSGTIENLNKVIFNTTDNEWVIVGDNDIVLRSTDGITWTDSSVFETDPTFYNVQGGAFTSGYGPEELVPGLVSDTLNMIVVTRPGTNWIDVEYQHVGYNVVSEEVQPQSSTQTLYKFANIATTPAQLAVFLINQSTGLSTSLYQDIDYTVDWVNKNVILNTPLNFVSIGNSDSLRIDVYEVGNGDQLVKSNTENNPIQFNATTGFQEIYVDANYTADITQGSGVVRPLSTPEEATAFSTNETTDAITLNTVAGITLNLPIRFSGAVFGNIVEDQVYYVKTISSVSKRITISETYNTGTGTAGATFQLATATGQMTTIIRTGLTTPWTDPAVYHNGTKMVLGYSSTVTRTRADRNTVTCNTTNGLIVNTPVVFSATIFGGITANQTYYISSIYDGNEFTISETPSGSNLQLVDATGGATFITNDFAFGLADNGVSASMIFATTPDTTYNEYTDYLTYTLFGETYPVQYGATIPQTQVFVGNGSTASFNLTNYVSGSNPKNAIVEVDGKRLTYAQYSLSPLTNTLLLYTPPANGVMVAVTTYNLTDRQYLNTQYGITGASGVALTTVIVTSTTHVEGTFDQNTPSAQTYDENSPSVVTYDELFNYLSIANTGVLAINQAIVFNAPTIGGIVAGTTYYVTNIINGTDFTVSTQSAGSPITVTTASGSMVGVINGMTVSNIVGISNTISPQTQVIISGTTGGGLNYVLGNTTSLVPGETITFETPLVTAGSFVVGKPYSITSLGTTTQAQWNTIAGTSGQTYIVGSMFTCANAGTGTGTGTGSLVIGGIKTGGEIYFVLDIISGTAFTVADQYGSVITLSTDSTACVAFAGGQSAIRVTTGINTNFVTNDLVRIDGTLGSVQLNNNTYYVRVISDKVFDLYAQPFVPGLNSVNTPITSINTYGGGGFAWLDQLFTISITQASGTSSVGNLVIVTSTDGLVVHTPISFTKQGSIQGTDLMGGVLADVTYYINNVVDNTHITISETQYGDPKVLYTASGFANVSQFEQINVDRLWVTVSGNRIPSSKLQLNPYNNLSILTTISAGDEVIITSMMPTATPNEEIFMLTVGANNNGEVYRTNVHARTWLVKPLQFSDTTVYVNDVNRITDTVIQNTIAPAEDLAGIISIGINADKNSICDVLIYNNTTGQNVTDFSLAIVDLAPIAQIASGVSENDSLTITIIQGNLLYINGEKILFTNCDTATNSVQILTRGAYGTAEQNYIPTNTEVFGLLSRNLMTNVLYKDTWNSYIYNPIDGDPLQISQTTGANFLKVDRS